MAGPEQSPTQALNVTSSLCTDPAPWLGQRRTEAAAALKALEAELHQRRKQIRLWDQLTAAAEVEAYWQVLALLKAKPFQILPRAEREDLRAWAESRARQAQSRFPQAFADACAALGLVLDPVSRHPDYSLSQSFFRVRILDKQGQALILTPAGQTTVPADPTPLAQSLAQAQQRIWARPFAAEVFAEELRRRYALCLAAGLSAPIPLRRLFADEQVPPRRKRRDEPADAFIADLLRLLATPLAAQLELIPTRDTAAGVFLPLPLQPGYFGWLALRP